MLQMQQAIPGADLSSVSSCSIRPTRKMDTDLPPLDLSQSVAQLSLNTHTAASRPHGPKMAIIVGPGQRHPAVSRKSPARDFMFFALLPSELQTKIWMCAVAADAKVIEMKHQDYYYFNNFELVSKEEYKAIVRKYRNNKTDHRGLLGACYASRQAILHTLQPLRVGYKERVLFNPEMDTIYFGPSSYVRWWSHTPNQAPLKAMQQYQPAREQDTRPSVTDFRSFKRSLHPSNFEHNTGFYHTSGLHPLMVDQILWEQRAKIVNVAFEHEFWRWTERDEYLIRLFHRFPNAKNIVLAVGDVGENGKRDDYGQCMAKSKPCGKSCKGEVHGEHLFEPYDTALEPGNVGLVRGAVQFTLNRFIDQMRRYNPGSNMYKFGMGLELETQLVTRGGRYHGHKSRVEQPEIYSGGVFRESVFRRLNGIPGVFRSLASELKSMRANSTLPINPGEVEASH